MMEIELRRGLAQRALDHVERCRCLEIEIAVVDEARNRRLMRVDHRARPRRGDHLPCLGRGGDDEIGREQQIGAAGGDTLRRDALGIARQPHMAHHRAAFLREAGDVEHLRADAVDMAPPCR